MAKWFTGVCGAVFKKPLATGLFMLICIIDVGLDYFCSISIVGCHFHTCWWAECGYVDSCIFVCLFVCFFVNLPPCTVMDFSAGDKASSVKFCTMVHGRPGHGISHFGELRSSRSPKSDESLIDASPLLTACSPSVDGTGVYRQYLPLACVDIRPSPEDEYSQPSQTWFCSVDCLELSHHKVVQKW